MQLPDVNLDAISDPATREVVRQLLNSIEAQAAEIASLRAENQQLRDENARLKGGSGKPTIKPSVPPPPADHSSEAQRHTPHPRGKPKKNQTLTVTREERCLLDPATLPEGARFNGTRETIAQNLIFQVEVIRFLREEWFVPATNQTILAPLPPGYCGGFSPTLQTLIPALGHDTANVSQPALLHFLRTIGVSIGAGTVARLLADSTGRWAEEAEAIHQAGLASGPCITSHVIGQLDQLPADTSHVVVSVGGNNALMHSNVLHERVQSAAEVFQRIAEIGALFEQGYQEMLQAVLAHNLPTTLCTIYYPCFADPAIQQVTVAGLLSFNDAILRAAFRAGVPVIDLRLVCTSPADYANEIEPSVVGGAKIAEAIVRVVTQHDFTRPGSTVYF